MSESNDKTNVENVEGDVNVTPAESGGDSESGGESGGGESSESSDE